MNGEASQVEKAGILLGLLAMACFSAGDGIWKHVLFSVPIASVFCINAAVSAGALLLYARVKGLSLKPRSVRNAVIFTLLYILEQITFIYALGHMGMAELFVIILTTPLCVLIGARVWLREILSPLQSWSIVCGFAGAVIVVLSHAEAAPADFSPLVILAALANVGFGSSKILFMRQYCREENGYSLSLVMSLTLAAGGAMVAGPDLLQTPLADAGWLVASGLLSILGMVAYVAATQKARAP